MQKNPIYKLGFVMVVWIYGLSGAGKTELSTRLNSLYSKRFGCPTVLLDGDTLRGAYADFRAFTRRSWKHLFEWQNLQRFLVIRAMWLFAVWFVFTLKLENGWLKTFKGTCCFR